MSILVGIDGTGADVFPGQSRDARYAATFANSFVSRLCTEQRTPNKKYLKGPVLLGGLLEEAVREGHIFINTRRQAGVNEPILLTGYSRGATGVVNIAKILERQNIDVKAMLLFDCVDRHAGIDAMVIPKNVGYVLHVLRAPESGSRGSFGNTARQYNSPTRYEEAIFHCTHGGMGGVPWAAPAGQSQNDFIVESWPDGKTNVTYAQDTRGSERVWTYVKPFIGRHGFQ
ncbi:MAG TPA: hypothetical protein VI479_03285 [Blastocatellia bacterium]